VSLHSLNPAARNAKIFNARVFDLSKEDELQMYNVVMRRYGDMLVNSPPNFFFSAKEGAVKVYIDWMSEFSYEEEFLGEARKTEPAPLDPQTGVPVGTNSAISRLAARLQGSKLPAPALELALVEQEVPTDDPGTDPE